MDLAPSLHHTTARLDFALARNDFLNAMADVETAICKLLAQAGASRNQNEPFGNRLRAFGAISNAAVISKCRIGQRNQLVDAIARLLPLRADLVHSRMQISDFDGQAVALFTNAQIAFEDDAPLRILSIDRLRKQTAELTQYAEKIDVLRKPINPPSSPPPPSPGAAVDP